MDGLAWRLGEEPFFTDKQPANFLNTGFICQALPQAKILHMPCLFKCKLGVIMRELTKFWRYKAKPCRIPIPS